MTRSFRVLLGCALVAVTAGTALAKSFVLPHVLEKSGRITDTTFTFDTDITITYAKGLTDGKPAKGAQAALYLYNDDGTLMQSGLGQDVCGPCNYSLAAGGARKVSINVEQLILDKGGFGNGISTKTGFGVIVVSGDDKNVAVQGFVVNSHSGPFDLSFQKIEMTITK